MALIATKSVSIAILWLLLPPGQCQQLFRGSYCHRNSVSIHTAYNLLVTFCPHFTTTLLEVILNEDDWSSLVIYAEHSLALEPKSGAFSVYQVAFLQLLLCWEGLNVHKDHPSKPPLFAYFPLYSSPKRGCCFTWFLLHHNLMIVCQVCDLSGCCGSVTQHWQLKPKVPCVWLPVTAGFFPFLFFHLIISKFCT